MKAAPTLVSATSSPPVADTINDTEVDFEYVEELQPPPAGARFDLKALATIPIPPNAKGFQAQPATVKQQTLINLINSAPYAELPKLDSAGVGGGIGVWQKLKNLAGVFKFSKLRTTFDRSSDVKPGNEPKLFHPFGAVAAVQFEAKAGHPFTGLFKTGAPGVARLSLAAPPGKDGLTPGIALKLFVDGQPSRNIMAINGLEPQGDDNFFGPTVSNKIPKPKGLVLRFLTWVTSFVADPLTRPVKHLASVNKNGAEVQQPNAPTQIWFEPSAAVKSQLDPSKDFRAELAKLAPGTPLYNVLAAGEDGVRYDVGTVRSQSQFKSTRAGDQNLFFEHPR